MKSINKSLENLSKELNNHQLLEYEYLPDLELYMDQLTSFLDRIFNSYQIEYDQPLITQAMVNNYVRGEVIDKPYNKRYNKDHLAKIIEVALLKQVVELEDIKEIFASKKKKKISNTYNDFVEKFNDELQIEAKKLKNGLKKAQENDLNAIYDLAIGFAIKAVINKMMEEKILKYIEIYKKTKDE